MVFAYPGRLERNVDSVLPVNPAENLVLQFAVEMKRDFVRPAIFRNLQNLNLERVELDPMPGASARIVFEEEVEKRIGVTPIEGGQLLGSFRGSAGRQQETTPRSQYQRVGSGPGHLNLVNT